MKIIILSIFALVNCQIFAQLCKVGTSKAIEISNTKSITNKVDGSFIGFNDFSKAGYNLILDNAVNNPIPLVFTAAIWIGGRTIEGDLKLAATKYPDSTQYFDWYPGPLDETGQTNALACKNFDNIFATTFIDLELAHGLLYNADGSINEDVCNELPNSIKYWPGKGNPYFQNYYNFILPNQELASFYDKDKNGLYNPCKGDLPSLITSNFLPQNEIDVLNSFPEKLSYWVVNDNGGAHLLTSGEPMKMELHNYMFSFDSKEYTDMTFYKFKTIYKGNDEMKDVFFSVWVDFDIGCFNDDYVGSVPEEKLMYGYNGDLIDGIDSLNKCLLGGNPYTNKMPIVGVSYLEGFKKTRLNDQGITEKYDTGLTSCTYTNSSIFENVHPSTTDPADRDYPFYNVMRGMWISGEPITYGGTGFNPFDPSNKDTTYYVFNGNPSNPNEWSMCKEKLIANDLRFNLNTGGDEMKYGDSNDAIIALTFVREVDYPCPDNNTIIDQNKKARLLYDNQWNLNKTSYFENPHPKQMYSFSHSFEGFNIKNINEDSYVTVFDLEGKTISKDFLNAGFDYNWLSVKYGLNDKMIFVKIQSIRSGFTKCYKAVVLNH